VRVTLWVLLLTLERIRQWRQTSSTAARLAETEANRADYRAAGPKDRAEMYIDAEKNLEFRQKTANTSYIVGGLLAGVSAGLLSQHFKSAPTYVIGSYVCSLIALAIGVYPAISELIRRRPTERAVAIRRRAKAENAEDGVRAEAIRTDRYAQLKQRVSHLQRSVFRFRWGMAVGLVILVQALPVLIWAN